MLAGGEAKSTWLLTVCSVCIISILRIDALNSLRENDFPYTVVPDANYAALEVELATICACLPFYRPLLGRFFPKSRLGTKKMSHAQWTGRNTRFKGTENMSFDPFPLDTTCSRAYAGDAQRQSSDDSTAKEHGEFGDQERIFVNQSIDVYYSPR